jgi:hypothetical protein
MSKPEIAAPSAPRLTLRVGVAGHRPAKLAHDTRAIHRAADQVLGVIADCIQRLHAEQPNPYSAESPRIRVLSELAEGADRIVSKVALARGLSLECILPFAMSEYESDFQSAESRDEFRGLVARATSKLELDGDRHAPREAYAEAGRMLLRQCDILLAVWNGGPGEGDGGTANLVEQALAAGMPVVWIGSDAPHSILLPAGARNPRSAARPLVAIADDLERILLGAGRRHDFVPPVYYGRGRPRLTRLGIYRRFRALAERGHRHARGEEVQSETLDSSVRAEFEWADHLAIAFGERYRDSFVANYLMAAAAVGTALGGAFQGFGVWTTIAELVLIAAILVNTHVGRTRHWHEQWLGYRLLAEQLRHLQYLRPIGCPPPPVRAVGHFAGIESELQWGAWLFQARLRELPMIDARFDAPYIARVRSRIDAELQNQQQFHTFAASRSTHVHHWLHSWGGRLFAITAAVCLFHLYIELGLPGTNDLEEHLFWLLTLLPGLSAFLPALGAALAGIDNHGEFARVGYRSGAMQSSLATLRQDLARLDPVNARTVGRAGEQAAQVMLTELVDWQLIFWGRPITLPA